MNKRNLFFSIILLTVVIIATVSLLIFKNESPLNANKENKESNQGNNIELLFGSNYISYIIEDDTMSFNIFAVQKIKNTTSSVANVIQDVSFNNENIEITEFSVELGNIYNGYKLINFIVDVKATSNNIEKADEFIIYFKNGKSKSYDIGEVSIQNDIGYSQNDIIPEGEYVVSYPFPSLNIKLFNNSKESITLNKIEDLNKMINYTFKENREWKPQEINHILVSSFDVKNEFDFYTITPILRYSINGSDYAYNMPGVIYGIFIPDEEKVKKIISQ